MVKVHVVDLKSETIAPPVSVRAYLNQTVTEFKQLIAQVPPTYPSLWHAIQFRCWFVLIPYLSGDCLEIYCMLFVVCMCSCFVCVCICLCD